MSFLRRCSRYLVVVKYLPDCRYHVSFGRYRPLNLPLSRKVIQKRWYLGPRFVGGWDTQISEMHFQITFTSDHVAKYG